jgi:rhodanese-related sulfurtransferase
VALLHLPSPGLPGAMVQCDMVPGKTAVLPEGGAPTPPGQPPRSVSCDPFFGRPSLLLHMTLAEFVIKYWMLWGLAACLALALLATFIPELVPGAPPASPTEVTRLINRERALVLDLRAEAEYALAHLPGAIRIDPAKDAERIRTLIRDKNRPVVLHASDTVTSGKVYRSLTELGVARVFRLHGGLEAWRAASLPVAGQPAADDRRA